MGVRNYKQEGAGNSSVGSQEYWNECLSRDPEVYTGNKRTKGGGATRVLSSAPGLEE